MGRREWGVRTKSSMFETWAIYNGYDDDNEGQWNGMGARSANETVRGDTGSRELTT